MVGPSGDAPGDRPPAGHPTGGGDEVAVRFPEGASVGVGGLLAGLTGAGLLGAGDERVRDFLVAFGRRLLRPELARRHPELASLGFFLRPRELARTVEAVRGGEYVRVPRGLVFHVPPANVDTVFVYSWALSALMGNRNVVRLSTRAGPVASVLLRALQETLDESGGAVSEAVAATQRIVSYTRSDAITASLSAACDLRVIWGGDRTVDEVRRHPLAPHARDLTFPDRSSFALVLASAWLAAPAGTREAVADGFAADAYWFDQAACSSPRTVFWVGVPADCDAARDDFTTCLARAVARRGWTVDAAMAVEKRVATYGLAADGVARSIGFHGNAVTGVVLTAPEAAPRRRLGTGTFAHARIASPAELVRLVRRADQTMTHFGFSRAQLAELAGALAGRGVDRMVPIGEALGFQRVWDGYDLPAEFTRLVTIR
ncbi:hypothetical protein FHU36_007088 [Nonomuraea muscovyensis]|uniref:Long-chain-fatty-acyl-CoA reductase n=1 Tax=Nonomuraea muscovyensis TaxID=1124761 RepID=A0A7X0CB67_9ACTN|nr:acyl-CoA reductase [Nonomuraea muscovyensis]MBB6350516.1 hypothetical protein [Nonomuraea muscovyensis]